MYPDELALAKQDSAVTQGSTLENVGSRVGLTFDELFERYHSMVFGLVFHILGDREEALDVSQEVFLTVFRKMDSFRGESSLKTWIYCIAVNRAANRFRWWNRLRRRGTVSLGKHLSNSPDHELFYNLKSDIQSPEEALLLSGRARENRVAVAAVAFAAEDCSGNAGYRRALLRRDCRIDAHFPRHRQIPDCQRAGDA